VGKKIGLWEAVAIGIGGMVGGGIFAVLGLAAGLAHGATPVAFFLAGIVAALTSYSYAKLSVRYPSRGGTVEFLGVAFRNGMLVGSINVLLLMSYIIMLSLYAYAFGSYAAALLGGGELVKHIFISLVVLAFTFLNFMGADVVGRAEKWIVWTKIAILLLFVLAGIWFVQWTRLSPSNWPDPLSLIAGGMIIFLAYEGFELIANTAEDVKNPGILPKAFYISVGFVILLYVLVAIVAVGNLPIHALVKARDYALAAAARPVLGKLGFTLIAIAALLSTASAINATLYGSARISYILAVKRELPAFLEKKVWNKPIEGLILVSAMTLLVANTVDLSGISTMGSAGFLIVFMAVNIAAFVLRRETGANPVISGTAAVFCFLAFVSLLVREWIHRPENVVFFAVLVAFAFLTEFVYRTVGTRGRIHLKFWKEKKTNA